MKKVVSRKHNPTARAKARKPAAVCSTPTEPAFGAVTELIRSTIAGYCDVSLLRRSSSTGSVIKQSGISWSFGLTNTDQLSDRYMLTITVRSGPFGGLEKMTSRGWWRLSNVTLNEVTNALFASLTFEGSPFYYQEGLWYKRMEITG